MLTCLSFTSRHQPEHTLHNVQWQN